MTLRNRLGLLFLLFLGLVITSVTVTAWMVRAQDQDALVINLAGRQRMLVQQITSQALQIQSGRSQNENSQILEHRQILHDAEITFDRTLAALMDGGGAPYLPGQVVALPATTSRTIRTELHALAQQWAAFQVELRTLETTAPDSASFDAALQSLQALSPQLVQQADDIVRLYEAESERKLEYLQLIQAGFFLAAVGLLVAGVVIVRRGIITPLQTLKAAAKQIGQGDLSSPVQIADPPELADLATSVDAMRAQLKTLTGGLEARIQQRTRELAALYDVIREISSHLELARVLDSVTGKARDLLGSDVAFLCLLDGAAESLTLKAHNGPEEAVCGSCVLAQHSVAGQVLGRRDAMICESMGCQTIAPDYRASHLAAPLRVGERVIGALCVGSTREATYSQEQVRLLTELANSTAIALENARLYEQAERVATLEERQRIAADMHDGLAQTLSYVRLKIGRVADLVTHANAASMEQAARELSLISDAVDRAGNDVRQSIASLRAVPVPDRPLYEHLARVIENVRPISPDLAIDLVGADDHVIALDNDVVAQILRVVQEALQNACRHAHAARVTVSLDRHESNYRIIIQDDGCGFEPSHVNGAGHFGLNIMQARASRIGGSLTIDSSPGQGTRVILAWPVRHAVPVQPTC